MYCGKLWLAKWVSRRDEDGPFTHTCNFALVRFMLLLFAVTLPRDALFFFLFFSFFLLLLFFRTSGQLEVQSVSYNFEVNFPVAAFMCL